MEEDAHREFTPRADHRRRETREGWRHELVDHPTFRRLIPCLIGKCEHELATHT